LAICHPYYLPYPEPLKYLKRSYLNAMFVEAL
jgi:hypothetical protein